MRRDSLAAQRELCHPRPAIAGATAREEVLYDVPRRHVRMCPPDLPLTILMKPGFSVIIPLYNKAPHVRAAVQSALAQSLQPIEVIVVDDGSTDGGLELLKGLEDRRLKLLSRSPPGPGGYAARNLGVEAATGDWIAFLDADDAWARDHLQTLADAISSCPSDVGCAFSGTELVYSTKRQARRHSARYVVPRRLLSPEDLLHAWVDTGECPLWTGSVAFQRALLVAAGLFPAGRTRRGGDKDLWLRAIMQSGAVYTGRYTAEFHQDTTNRVSNLTPHDELPIICGTIAAMLASQPSARVALLRRISNLEIANYARYSAGRGAPFFSRFARQLYYPEGLRALPPITAYFIAGWVKRIARLSSEPIRGSAHAASRR
jgi:succinoglycan biosynthesis protein ExoO